MKQNDKDILRRLAERKATLADHPLNRERRDLWYALDRGEAARPLVLTEMGGIRDARHPQPDSDLKCEDPDARKIEFRLRCEIYNFEEIADDRTIEAVWNVPWQVTHSGYGVEIVTHHGDNDGRMGSRRWDPPIADLDRDFHKLRQRAFSVDRTATLSRKQEFEALFEGILTVRLRGSFWWTFGLTWRAIELIGLENLMLYMYDNPAGLHRLMAFLRDDHLAHARWLEAEGLLSLNNEDDSIGSGSIGYTRGLPQPDFVPGGPVRMRDLWVLLESQETVGVGPDLFAEFVFPYQLAIAREFGRCYYGCCEPVNSRWHILKQLPNLRRVSVSPWADQDAMAEACGRSVVFSRKPNPALISTEGFDEKAIRDDLRHTCRVARHCPLEIIMKDVHTLNNEPDRLARWVRLAREVIAAEYGR